MSCFTWQRLVGLSRVSIGAKIFKKATGLYCLVFLEKTKGVKVVTVPLHTKRIA